MPTLEEVRQVDTLGITRFTAQQAKAMVDMVRRTRKLESEPPACEGRGIVIAGGGVYLSWAWVLCRRLRDMGCELPIQVWHLGSKEMPIWAAPLFRSLDAEPVDAHVIMKHFPVRRISGWTLKNYAIAHCPWEQVLFLDADCFPAVKPEVLMEDPEVRQSGGIFFSDIADHRSSPWAYVYCGLTLPEREWEAGQYIINKRTGWMGLRWAYWLNEHAEVWFDMVHGDKGTLELGFRMSGVPHIISTENEWGGFGISQKWKGVEYFQHCMGTKRGEFPMFPWMQEIWWQWEAQKPETLA